MASNPHGAVLLVGLGIRTISIRQEMIGEVRTLLSGIDLESAENIAEQALNCANTREVQRVIQKLYA